ncbi:carboxynorspermidine decarboxylase [Alloprevotella tannerae]|jgi:carboxynorspermidine decarboxylase|uniref:carboxynorspermidine decarboxylase n=1 Tax=Alloprevotella tannerae TaxID=76122 RepID=UPI001EDA2777|nr:carboxynorspermidine decarboxylase [Alloprevotella tannerae]MCG2646814.1 carboxynorspermidine decarboxylase [Alloprevotella tannerae]MCG2653194.1 carboxynorspermidine decarboxylase [Alloprevotella tannerae]
MRETPYYRIEERLLRNNLALIRRTADEAGVEFILAFKAFALWKTFFIFRDYIAHTTASSPNEARLAFEEFGSKAHTYSPAYEDKDFDTIMRCSSHITFNSLQQFEHFYPRIVENKKLISCGLRINPQYSEIETTLYNPCAPGSRFGILAEQLPDKLPEGVEGFHCHNHCESSAAALVHTLEHIEARFGKWLPAIKWLNLGGGHLLTRKDYDVRLLIDTLKSFKARYPQLHLILEPGSAFAWQTGDLFASVVDIVENDGIKTAILNVSFTCHMPDCLEMPYWPAIRGAETLEPPQAAGREREPLVYRLGGNSCLSGDFMGYWRFEQPLQIGDTIRFSDMIHYTTVKTNMFNGIPHPSLVLLRENGEEELLRRFGYEDYRDRMD